MTRLLLPLLLALGVGACTSFESLTNPLIGRWAVEAPGAAFNLGTAEFRAGRMIGFGLDQEVEYAVEGNVVRIMPLGFGPQLEASIIDRNTAELGSPLFGQILRLRRLS
jgi:hypothetical protein